jgi:alkanesulfonate monooxygenase SsuD/methylene tetrahydromethanopterin reductase-like flavin-dependent oxidoreductase (luciferase family)
MDVGVQMVFQNWHDGLTDEQMIHAELDLGIRADALGFDALWIVEHHFTDYAMCPDNAVALAYLAGRTQQIRLGTGAVILPWNDPLRVAEKMILLDTIAGERVVFGMGRGLARIEYEGFGCDMGEARERFDESAAMILGALETGVISGDGPFYPQPRVEIRPQPQRSFRDRVYSVAGSPDSAASAAQLGAGLLVFLVSGYDFHADAANRYRALFEEHHHRPAPPVVFTEFLFVHEDEEEAERMAREYIGRYYVSVIQHYDYVGDHFRDTKGYGFYAESAQAILDLGMQHAQDGYVERQLWGTPDQVIEKVREQQRELGDMHLSVGVSYAGMPFETVHANMELFAEKVLPAVRRL